MAEAKKPLHSMDGDKDHMSSELHFWHGPVRIWHGPVLEQKAELMAAGEKDYAVDTVGSQHTLHEIFDALR